MNCIMKFLSDNAAAITALATVVIALFTFLMWWVSHRIHEASRQRDKEMKELYLVIMSTLLVSGKTVGEPDLAVRLIKEQTEKLQQVFVTPKPQLPLSFFSFLNRTFKFKKVF